MLNFFEKRFWRSVNVEKNNLKLNSELLEMLLKARKDQKRKWSQIRHKIVENASKTRRGLKRWFLFELRIGEKLKVRKGEKARKCQQQTWSCIRPGTAKATLKARKHRNRKLSQIGPRIAENASEDGLLSALKKNKEKSQIIIVEKCF